MLEVFRIYAHKRSGQHAIIEWLISCMEGKVVYYNNLWEPNFKRRGTNYRWNNNTLESVKDTSYFKSFDHPKISDNQGNRTFLIYNFEDYSPDILYENSIKFPEHGINVKLKHIFISRYYKNLIASRFKKGGSDLKKYDTIAKFFDWFNYLNKVYHINYDRWMVDIEYRKQICKDLDLNFVNRQHKESTTGFSSFGEIENTLNRYEQMKDNKEYIECIKYMEKTKK